jgi:hypothetical protein
MIPLLMAAKPVAETFIFGSFVINVIFYKLNTIDHHVFLYEETRATITWPFQYKESDSVRRGSQDIDPNRLGITIADPNDARTNDGTFAFPTHPHTAAAPSTTTTPHTTHTTHTTSSSRSGVGQKQ